MYVVDTSAVIEGKVSELIEKGIVKKLVVPRYVIGELEYMANHGREEGFSGLSELQKIQELSKEGKVSVEIVGGYPTLEDIKMDKVDARIRDVAREYKAVLITGDLVQAEAAKAEGIEVYLIKPEKKHKQPFFIKLFDEETLSVHIREDCSIFAKKGMPGNVKLVKIGKSVKREDIEKMIREIVWIARRDKESYFEIEREGATVIQYREYRITIARPPFSDKLEITIVRPIKKVSLDEWNIDKTLKKRLEKAEGILIAGPPGMGKSTLGAALADYYASKGKIVKTMESPRDLLVGDEITQYAPLEGSFENTADVLLLARPDYTIFDEMRKTKDFEIYADLRLAGVGMIGIVHASRAIDAIHRLISRVELGMIPQVVDTVIFVKNAKIEKVYTLSLTVKVPTGMTEEDLARPVVEIRDFHTGELEYEIYTFGEQTIVASIEKIKGQKARKKEKALEILKKYGRVEIGEDTIYLFVSKKIMKKLLAKKGRRVKELEKKIGMKIEIIPA